MTTEKITNFRGEYAFLSNFSHSLIVIDKDEIWDTAEHLYQASKTLDKNERNRLYMAVTPGKAKRLGRKVTLRPDWEEIKYDIMLNVVRLKFTQNLKYAYLLYYTQDKKLIEGNTWHDNEWGNCNCLKCQDIVGKNYLGKILMQIRAELKERL